MRMALCLASRAAINLIKLLIPDGACNRSESDEIIRDSKNRIMAISISFILFSKSYK